jgi:predicted dehydrogenase
MAEKMRVAVVGLGSRGRYLASEFARHPQTQLIALCDNDEQALAAARRTFGEGVAVYTDQDAMCARESFGIGVVASWDPAHCANAVTFLQHRKHVYLEKPMAQTIADCDAILRAWETSSATLMVGLELRYCTLCQDMRRLLDADAIGQVKLGMAVDNVSVGGQYYYHNNRRRKDFIRSLMIEKGTHTLDLMNWFIGSDPIRAFGEGGLDVFGGAEPNDKRCRDCERKATCPYFIEAERFAREYGETSKQTMDFCVWAKEVDVDDNSVITVRYANGAKMTYTECHFTPDYNRHFILIGDKGRMTAFYNNEQEFLIRIEKRHSTQVEEVRPSTSSGGHGGGDPKIIEEFLRRAAANEHSCPGAVDARNSAAIAIAAAESCETHQPVAIPRFEFQ